MNRRLAVTGLVAVGVASLVLVAAWPLCADDMWLSSGLDLSHTAWSLGMWKLGIALLVLVPYVLITIGMEAWILGAVLSMPFLRAVGYAVAANFASGAVGAVWWLIGGEMGWKTAVVEHRWALASMAVVRSFLVTLAIETVVLIVLLRRRRDMEQILRGSAWANGASYVLVFLLLILATAMWPYESPSTQAWRGEQSIAATQTVAARASGGAASLAGVALAGPAPAVRATSSVPRSGTIHHAARRGDLADVTRHLKTGAEVNARDAFGSTALHYAAAVGDVRVVEVLTDAGADVNAANHVGTIPLHAAARTGHREVVTLLLDRGADANAKDDRGRTPLAFARTAGMKALLRRQGDQE